LRAGPDTKPAMPVSIDIVDLPVKVRAFGMLNAARRRSEILAALVYLGASLLLILYFRFCLDWSLWSWTDYYEIVALLGGALLAVSSFRVVMRRKYSDLIALIGALLAWPHFGLVESNRSRFSPWVLFNTPGPSRYSRSAFLIATLTILAIASLFAATAYSALRLTPRTWHIGRISLRDRAWPGFAISVLFVGIWYLTSVSPYRIPIFDLHGTLPLVSVLHVEKHGLQFHETYVAFHRDGQFHLIHDDRKLFQYSFQTTSAHGYLTEDQLRLLNAVVNTPPEFKGARVWSHRPPDAWNADRWMVFVQAKAGQKPIDVEVSVVPQAILMLFYDAQKLPYERGLQNTARDVCLGFCYDPTY
jgi:hypothetical protein